MYIVFTPFARIVTLLDRIRNPRSGSGNNYHYERDGCYGSSAGGTSTLGVTTGQEYDTFGPFEFCPLRLTECVPPYRVLVFHRHPDGPTPRQGRIGGEPTHGPVSNPLCVGGIARRRYPRLVATFEGGHHRHGARR